MDNETFWDVVAAGALSAMQEGINEPFGLWPCPPHPRHLPTDGLPDFKFR